MKYMGTIPKSKIRLLELQTVPVSTIDNSLVAVDVREKRYKDKQGKLSGLVTKFTSKLNKASESSKASCDAAKRTYVLNVAAWLRFGLNTESRLATLCLCYEDSTGEYVTIVEEREVEDKVSVMLASLVEINTKGPIISLKVCCAGLRNEDRCYIEDLFVERQTVEEKEAV